MAGLMRLGVVRAVVRGSRGFARSTFRRDINTSSSKTSVRETAEACPTESKNWISHGFSEVDQFVDRLSMHVTAFVAISLVLVTGGFYFAHLPDPKLIEWSQREAYLELRRRESLGLEPIDADYHPPDKVKLPTDEELGDTVIII